MRYVSLILMHGGLPVKALPRFVEQVVPTLMQHQWASPSQLGLLAAEAAERHRLPLVVQRYFRYGGRIAGEFAARAAELARRFLSESDNSALAISAQEIGLPKRVAQQIAHLPVQTRQPNSTRVSAWKPARLRFDAPRGAVLIDLPSQTVDCDEPGRWNVDIGGGELQFVNAPAWRNASGWATSSMSISLDTPARVWSAQWKHRSDSSIWNFPGFTETTPFLAFDGKTGRWLDHRDGLPRDPVWLLLRTYLTIPNAEITEEISLSGAWNEYSARLVALGNLPDDQYNFSVENTTIEVQPFGDIKPHLSIDALLDGVMHREARVYAAWPRLLIPQARSGDTLEVWQFGLIENGAYRPIEIPESAASRYEKGWAIDTTALGLPSCVPLALRLRGPLGRSKEVRFSVWPMLSIQGAGQVLWPNEDGVLAEATLHVFPPQGWTAPRMCSVERHERKTLLCLKSVREGKEEVLEVHIYRPLWQVFDASLASPREAQAQCQPLILQQALLAQMVLPRVAVWSGNQHIEQLEIRLAGEKTIKGLRLGEKRALFDLNVLAHPMDEHPYGQLWVVAGGIPQCIGRWRPDLGWLNPVGQVTSSRNIRMSWKQGVFVSGAHMRLWSIWEPSRPPICCALHSAGQSSAIGELPDSLPPGIYLSEPFVPDPWDETTPPRPRYGSEQTFEVSVGTYIEREQYLRGLEGLEGALARYAAFRHDTSRGAAAWHEVARAATPADMAQVLAALTDGDEDTRWKRLAEMVKRHRLDRLEHNLSGHYGELVQALAHESLGNLGRAYAVALGLLDQPTPSLRQTSSGQFWSALTFACLPSDTLDNHLLDVARWLGLPEGKQAGDNTDDLDAEPSVTVPARTWIMSVRPPLGQAIDEQELALPMDLLDAMAPHVLGNAPIGLLSNNAQQDAVIKWLRRRSITSKPVCCTDAFAPREVAWLRTELHRCAARAHGLVSSVEQRIHPKAEHGEASAEANLPFVSAATALLLRLAAYERTTTGREALNDVYRIRSGALAVLCIAPELLSHDLVWMDLSLYCSATSSPLS